MALKGNTFLDLADLAKRGGKDTGDVIEMLYSLNPIMADAYVQECNMGTTHKHTIRTGLPSVAWGRLYKGIPQSKGAYAQVTDTTGFVRGLSTVDKELLKIAENPARYRLQEAQGFLEAIATEMQQKFFYGSTDSDPDQIKGLSDRFNDLGAANGTQIIDAGGTGSDNTSIWLIGWGPKACSLIYPKGTTGGITREDKGEQRVLDENGDAYYAEEELFEQHCGVTVGDWRHVVRICNIDVSELAAGNVPIYNYLRKAYYKNRSRLSPEGSRKAMYCNADVLEALDTIATNAGASDNFVRLKTEEVQGKEIKSYREFPIRELDATTLLNTEARVV